MEKLELDSLKSNKEIEEGFLECQKCQLTFPVIEKLPILWDDFSTYLIDHKILGGKLYHLSKTSSMKKFVKSSLSKTKSFSDDRKRN